MPDTKYKFCPYCAEKIRESAIKCRFCQTMLTHRVSAARITVPPSITRFPKHEQTEIQRLARFIPSKVIESILAGSEAMEEGERRDITILFADLVGFTLLTEKIDQEELKALIDIYFSEMAKVITKYEGTIDKFIGDAVMALFGTPVAHEDDPERALYAAFEMQHAVTELSLKLNRKLKLRIGISCGEVIVSGFGAEHLLDYTAIGDVVNLANRLQTQAKPAQIVVSKRIYERTHHAFSFHALGKVVLKGKAEPVQLYQLRHPIREYGKIPIREISISEFIGREKELETLSNLITDAKKRRGIIVHLKGEAGVGKTRLVYELRKKEQARGVKFHYGRCLSYGKGSPYLPFIDLLLRGFCQIPDAMAKKDAAKQIEKTLTKISLDLKKHIPYIQFLLAPEVVPASIITENPKTRMERIFQAIFAVIDTTAQQTPLVLELEDIQWADTLSLQLINYLIPKIANIPVVIFLVYRPYFSYPWLAEGKQHTLELQELSDRDSEKLIQHLLGLQKLPPGLIKKIMEKTEGNPFYAEEVVLYLEQTGTLLPSEHGWVLTKRLQEIEIPDTVQDVVLSRIDRLETGLKRILQCASVIGYRFRYRVLEYVLEVEQELEKELAGLVDAGLIFEQSLIPELEYLFRHAVTQEVTYNTLLVKRRKFFHGKIAQCLEKLYPARLDEHYELIAHHYAHSDQHSKALEYLEKAGDKCRILFANEAALDFYTQALDRIQYHTGTSTQAKEREATLLIHRGTVSDLIGEVTSALSDNLRAASVATRIKKIPLVIRAYQNAGELYRQLGKMQDGIGLEKKAVTFCRQLNDKRAELNCINRLAVIYRGLGKYEPALRYFQEVLKLSEKQKDLSLVAHAHNNLGLTYWSMGKYADAVQHIKQALEGQIELGDKKGQVVAANNLGILYEKLGKLNEAIFAYSDCVRLAREIGFKKGEVAGMSNIGWLNWLQGKKKDALTAYRYVLAESKKMGDIHAESIAFCNIGYVAMFDGDAKKALDYFQQGLELAEATKDHYPQVVVLNGLFELYIRTKKVQHAMKISKKVIPLLQQTKEKENAATTYRLLSALALANKNLPDANKFAKQANDLATQSGNLRDLAWCAVTLARIERENKRPDLATKWIHAAERIATQLHEVHCLKELNELKKFIPDFSTARSNNDNLVL